LSRWSRRFGTPVRALVTQGLISVLMALAVVLTKRPDGDEAAKQSVDGFEAILYYTSAVFWLFFFLTGLALFVLRVREPDVPRPFKVPGYPVVPALFCLWCLYLTFGAISERPRDSLIGLLILLLGAPLFFLPSKLKRARPPAPDDGAETDTRITRVPLVK
jgi:basic amino acid/polyamine antiporter, APA family